MSFQAKLEVNGKKYDLLQCSFSLNRTVSDKMKPTETVRGGMIHCTIEGSSDTAFYDWISDPFGKRDGNIKFLKDDSDATDVELKFTHSALINWQRDFDANSNKNPTTETITIAAKEIDFGGTEFKNNWPE